jgi:hypothetical protein
MNLIQQDWFKLAAQKDSNPALVEDHLNAFYSHFSNLLLERIVNMADLNVGFLRFVFPDRLKIQTLIFKFYSNSIVKHRFTLFCINW